MSHSHPQPVSLCRKRCVTQLKSLFPNTCLLSKLSIQLLSSSVLIHNQPTSIKLTSTVMWCGLQQLPKMTWMTRLLSFSECSLLFSSIEHPLFKSSVFSLHPGYQPPSRQAVSNKLLDKCHDKYQPVMKQLLNNKTVTKQMWR